MKKSNNVFVFGNGESRKDLNLDLLSEHGYLYGCNGIYRDHTMDGLIVVDGGMMHEVYESGYALENECHFRSFTKLPADAYPMIVDINLFEGWHKALHTENEREDRNWFVVNGTDPNQMMRLIAMAKKVAEDEGREFDEIDLRQKIGNHHQWVTWAEDEDKVEIIPDDYSGWSAGPIAVRVALDKHTPNSVYLLGFDLGSNTGLVNNVYKGTRNYVSQDAKEVPSVNWIKQHKQNFIAYPDVTFYRVVPNNLSDDDKVSCRVKEWEEFDNVKYITFDELKSALDIQESLWYK